MGVNISCYTRQPSHHHHAGLIAALIPEPDRAIHHQRTSHSQTIMSIWQAHPPGSIPPNTLYAHPHPTVVLQPHPPSKPTTTSSSHVPLEVALGDGEQWPVGIQRHDGWWGLQQLGLGVNLWHLRGKTEKTGMWRGQVSGSKTWGVAAGHTYSFLFWIKGRPEGLSLLVQSMCCRSQVGQ